MERPQIRIDPRGPDGNVFAILGRATAALKAAGNSQAAEHMSSRVLGGAHSYEDALRIMREYVKITVPAYCEKPVDKGTR